jgi:hypothetical protein
MRRRASKHLSPLPYKLVTSGPLGITVGEGTIRRYRTMLAAAGTVPFTQEIAGSNPPCRYSP